MLAYFYIPKRIKPLAERSQSWLIIICLVIIATISGCKSVGGIAAGATKPVDTLDAWRLQGRIGLQTSRDSGTASLQWEERAGRYQIDITAPLNANSIKLTGIRGANATLVVDAERYQATSLRALDDQVPDYPVPFEHLHFWVRGIPNPAVAVQSVNRDRVGDYRSFTQAGWEIDISQRSNYSGYRLPIRLNAVQGENQLKIAITQWSLVR